MPSCYGIARVLKDRDEAGGHSALADMGAISCQAAVNTARRTGAEHCRRRGERADNTFPLASRPPITGSRGIVITWETLATKGIGELPPYRRACALQDCSRAPCDLQATYRLLRDLAIAVELAVRTTFRLCGASILSVRSTPRRGT